MSAVLKKGAPSRSYPSKQRKLGPAPFASFEDLSDELESPGVGGDENKVNVMPEIKEDRLNEYGATCQSPQQGAGDEDTPGTVRTHKNVTATSSSSTVTFAQSYSTPASGPTSGLQTPSTPRIDISCASSSTPPSDESASEKELFQGGLGFAFHEEAVDELRSSTEELDLGEEEISSEEERRRRRLEEEEMEEQEIYRRSSHPANIFSRKASVPAAPPSPADQQENGQRKPSAHSLFLEGLLNRPCRHASFGHGDYMRPGATSSLSTHSAGSGVRSRSRSPSPHKMLFETSFCGSKPIPTKSMEQDSPPKDKREPSSLPPVSKPIYSYSQPQSTFASGSATPTTPSRFGGDGERRSPKKQMVITPSWEREVELERVCSELVGATGGPKDIDSSQPVSRSKTPLSYQPSSLGFDSRRPSTGRRSVSPHKMLLETSFCGNRPIPTRSMEQQSPPKDLPDLTALLAECNKLAGGSGPGLNAYCHKTVITAQFHRHSTSSSGDRTSLVGGPPPLQRKSDAGHYNLGKESGEGGDGGSAGPGCTTNSASVPYLPGSPESPKSSDLWQPISPRMELRSPFTPSSTSPREDACSISAPKEQPPTNHSHVANQATTPSTNQQVSNNRSSRGAEVKPSPSERGQVKQVSSTTPGSTTGKSVGFQSEKSESSRDHDDEDAEITTEMKISEEPTVTVEDVPIESKSFFQSDSFDEEGDLPYVPTTLPQEKSTGVPIIPVSERKRLALMLTTTPVQRPKVNRPANPASLSDYIEHSKNSLPRSGRGSVSGEPGAGGSGEQELDADGQPVVAKMKINLPREDSIPKDSGDKQRKSLSATSWADFANMGLRSPREIRRKLKEENGAVVDISSYHSDSSSTNDIPGAAEEEEAAAAESLLKLPKGPFEMDFDVHSNRSSVISQDEVQKSPSECSALLGSPDEPDSTPKKSSNSPHRD